MREMWFTFANRESFMGGESYGCSINEYSPCDWEQLSYASYYHKNGYSDKDVKSVIISNASFKKIPKKLIECFPNMDSLEIRDSQITELDMETMNIYKKLRRFCSFNNKISILSGDLFEVFEDLECIQFESSALIFVDPAILDGLNNLKHVEFTGNEKYNLCYSTYPGKTSSATLEEIKKHLVDQFLKFKYVRNLQKSVDQLKGEDRKEDLNPYLGLFGDVKKFLLNNNSRDFTISIAGRVYRVHKFVMDIRSPFMAQQFKDRPFANEFSFDDISAKSFEEIIKYVYTNELPEDTNFMNLFAAASKFQIKELEDYAKLDILNDIDGDNAIEVFQLAHKCNNDNLKTIAYKIIKEKYSVFDFKDAWLADCDELVKILEGFKHQEEELRKFRMKFERMSSEEEVMNIDLSSNVTQPATSTPNSENRLNNSF